MAAGGADMATKGAQTCHYRAVRKHYSDLVVQLEFNLTEIASKFFCKSLISLSELQEVTASRASYENATKLVTNILTKIESDIKFCYILIDVLENSGLRDIADQIERSREQMMDGDLSFREEEFLEVREEATSENGNEANAARLSVVDEYIVVDLVHLRDDVVVL